MFGWCPNKHVWQAECMVAKLSWALLTGVGNAG